MSEEAQISPDQDPFTDSSWQSDYDAVNGIQLFLRLLTSAPVGDGWGDDIDSDIITMSNMCQVIAEMGPLSDPYASLSSSDAVKLIAGLAEQLHALYPQPISGSPQDLIAANSNYIISACKDIDPSSAS
jgi:hypothetical protein